MTTENLPDEILNFFRLQNENLVSVFEHLSFYENESWKTLQSEFIRGTLNKVETYYKTNNFEAPDRTKSYLVANEALKNCFYHGGDGITTKISLMTLLTPGAFGYCFKDGGNYFKKQDIKEFWEGKRFHLEKHITRNKNIGYGLGTKIIYEVSDFIYVDTNDGTLFTGFIV